MFEALLITIYFSYKNALIAKAKGLNSIMWVLLSTLAFVVGLFIGGMIVVALFYHGAPDKHAIEEFMRNRPIHGIFICFTGIGGCLFIRYRLEQKQGTLPPKAETDESDQTD